MRKIVWVSGLSSGLLIGSNFFISPALSGENYDSLEWLGFSSMFLFLGLALFFGVKRINSEKYHGHIQFSQAFVASIYIVLIASVVYTLMWELYFQSSGADFVQNYLTSIEEKLKPSTLDPEVIESRLASQRQVMESYQESLLVRFSLTVTEIFPVGLLLSLLNGFLQSYLARRQESKS